MARGTKPENSSPHPLFAEVESLLSSAMISDRASAVRQLQRLKRFPKKKNSSKPDVARRLSDLRRLLEKSAQKRLWRLNNRPVVSYPPALPITAKQHEIIQAIKKNRVVIVSGETGSGKTTQIPKFCLEAGRGVGGMIGCTQPRRIAATTVSHRIAEELGESPGLSVGYKIRFREKTDERTFIKIMTDGILLAETQADPWLNAYDTLIVDEAHERSLNIDFVLGILKLLTARRKDLKLIITSATIDTKKFSKAFDDAPVIEVSGRMYPVEIRYTGGFDTGRENDEVSYVEAAVRAVETIHHENPFGDILVFMPTEQDIVDTCELIEGRQFKHGAVMPLFARLSASEQKRVFSRPSGRKIIVATNVAETSITIPGIKYVVDTGLARIAQYNPRSRITALPILPVSKSSADQRKGRCGRIENGVCIRTFTEEDYLSRPRYTKPEILRSNLAEVILRMLFLKLGSVESFPFIDKPAPKSVHDGFKLLLELGAIQRISPKRANRGRKPDEERVEKSSMDQHALTPIGKFMARIPIDPRLSRMIYEADRLGCLEEISIIAAALSIQDPRERPLEKEKEADEAHRVFADPQSDFFSLLNIWDRYNLLAQSGQSANQLKKYCRSHFISFKRMREWQDIFRQVTAIMREYRLKVSSRSASHRFQTRQDYERLYTAIHKSVLSGFLSNIAQKKEKQFFKAAREKEVMIFPGSDIFKSPGNWIVAAEFVETSRLFARTVANIEQPWLEEYGRDMCRSSYSNPRWDSSRGEVVADEQVSLFGLIIVPRRAVSYGPIAPKEAGDIFIRGALIQGDVQQPFAFLKHNQGLVAEINKIENRIRRRDILVDEDQTLQFYRSRLPNVFDIRTLKRLIKTRGDDRFLKLGKNDLQRYQPDPEELRLYPQKVDAGNHVFDCLYAFKPGKADDGVTINVPSSAAPSVDEASFEWAIPGLVKERIAHLLKGLPKTYRKRLVPISDTAGRILREMPMEGGALAASLSRFLHARMGIDIPASAWPMDSIPDHLQPRFEVTDAHNNILRSGRNPAILKAASQTDKETSDLGPLLTSWGKKGLRDWVFDDLTERVKIKDRSGREWELFPALEASVHAVNLRLFVEEKESLASHLQGVRLLFSIRFANDLKFLRKNLSIPLSMKDEAQYFGGIRRIEDMLYQSVVNELFLKNIRTRDAFLEVATTVSQAGVHLQGREKLEMVRQLISAYHAARTTLYRLENTNRGNERMLRFLDARRGDLSRLLPPHFVSLYDTQRLHHIQRYIKALTVRSQRGVVNLEKDRQREKEVQELTTMLDGHIKELTPEATEGKRQAVEEFHWLVEEYKVSVFAQEVGTAVKISKKKLISKSKEILRMV